MHLIDELPCVNELDREGLHALQLQAADAAGFGFGFRDLCGDGRGGPELAIIPPGRFLMGSTALEFGHLPDESPRRWVKVERPFAMGRFTVSAEEFDRFREASGFRFRRDLITTSGAQPVINLRLQQAQAYLDWLSEQTGAHYRLPTEAEWEYACRAGSDGPFHTGDSISCAEAHFNPSFPYEEQKQGRRWFRPRCLPTRLPLEAGRYPCNAWGLHDMHGNVWEFTASRWTDSHHGASAHAHETTLNPGRPIVVRGGSFFDMAVRARSAARMRRVWDELDTNIGFRVVREL